MSETRPNHRRPTWWIVMVYAIAAAVWISTTDALLAALDAQWDTPKGLAFVAVTSALLGIVLAHRDRTIRRLERRETDLLQRVRETEERERHRLARELHDGPIATLSAVALDLDRLDTDDAALEEVRERVSIATGALRSAMFELDNPDLRGMPFGVALSAAADAALAGSGITVVIDDHAERDVPSGSVVAAYRIVGEALRNVRQHSGASLVHIRTRSNSDSYTITVEDDGTGPGPASMATAGASPAHIGLQVMRDRAHAMHGWCRVAPRESGGTVVTVWIPLADPSVTP